MRRKAAVARAMGCVIGLSSPELLALPGIHAPAISTFDTRSSSIVLAYRGGLTEGTSRVFSYNANFTATSGNFSAQFGAHYLQLRDQPGVRLLHGAAASGVGLFSIPLSSRFDNGVPKTALQLYAGAVPTAVVSGPRNFLSAPLTLGVGMMFSPARSWSITPWIELAPSVNLDSYIAPFDLNTELEQAIDGEPSINEQGEVEVMQPDVNRIVNEAVDLRFSIQVAPRAGVQSILRLSDSWDFNLDASIGSFGAWLGGVSVAHLGVGLAAHWDNPPPGILPPERRLSHETCEAIEERYRMCPAYRRQRPSANPVEEEVPPKAPQTRCAEPQRETPTIRLQPKPAAPTSRETSPTAPQPTERRERPAVPEGLPPLRGGTPPLKRSPYGD